MTFSIVVRNRTTGRFGVATATGGPCVGALVPHLRAGVGAIATQGNTNPYYGFEGLDLLESIGTASEVIQKLTQADDEADTRQVVMIGREGPAHAHTGARALPYCDAIVGEDFAVAGNMLRNDKVVRAAADAIVARQDEPLADRLLGGMKAGEAAGGDQRGAQSAALKVVGAEDYCDIDLRIDLSADPIADLEKLLHESRSGAYGAFLAERPRKRS